MEVCAAAADSPRKEGNRLRGRKCKGASLHDPIFCFCLAWALGTPLSIVNPLILSFLRLAGCSAVKRPSASRQPSNGPHWQTNVRLSNEGPQPERLPKALRGAQNSRAGYKFPRNEGLK
ncbi:hypothetical protein G7K_4538-t1 [Saitoella complicata NRRL Y-17804]|uniref:Uncharacterized protein n=1 Tax=Saitoella complicata (strain BCRC 22490 / CBS 7301 / JCM 7358 / NBRC 10748 / NRRL Y-17804) TaxID=698492 RepID=A0A0E9NKM1_SAICN|nr:hypothetical protein G7K_4538-t1 [Saitoella complicata NRRL Y-17804]